MGQRTNQNNVSLLKHYSNNKSKTLIIPSSFYVNPLIKLTSDVLLSGQFPEFFSRDFLIFSCSSTWGLKTEDRIIQQSITIINLKINNKS